MAKKKPVKYTPIDTTCPDCGLLHKKRYLRPCPFGPTKEWLKATAEDHKRTAEAERGLI